MDGLQFDKKVIMKVCKGKGLFMKRNHKILLQLFIIGIIMFGMGNIKSASAATLNDYAVATKNDGSKTSTKSVSKNSFLTYLCAVKYKDKLTKYVDLEKYLYNSKSYHTIPGLKNTNVLGKNCDTMVPQGICRMGGYVLISSYDYEKNCNSVIYVLSSDGSSLYATLVYPSKSHVGGIAYDGSYLYVCNSTKKTVSVFKKSYIMGAINMSIQHNLNSIKLLKYKNLKVKTTASYCTYYDMLWSSLFVTL